MMDIPADSGGGGSEVLSAIDLIDLVFHHRGKWVAISGDLHKLKSPHPPPSPNSKQKGAAAGAHPTQSSPAGSKPDASDSAYLSLLQGVWLGNGGC